jgi:hypothetical protein
MGKMLEQAAAREIENISLSNNPINRRIDDTSHNAEEALCDKLENGNFSIQVDESIYSTDKWYVVSLVRFINGGEIQENFYCCKELPERSKQNPVLGELYRHLYSWCPISGWLNQRFSPLLLKKKILT